MVWAILILAGRRTIAQLARPRRSYVHQWLMTCQPWSRRGPVEMSSRVR